jgi:hypothetical protein
MDRIRSGLILAAALTALSATGAKADEWCGYSHHDDALVECGYATSASCESAVGKGGMCFVDPDIALNAQKSKRAVPSLITKTSARS